MTLLSFRRLRWNTQATGLNKLILSLDWLYLKSTMTPWRPRYVILFFCTMAILYYNVSWVGLIWGFTVALSIFQSYHNLETGDNHSLKSNRRDRDSKPGPIKGSKRKEGGGTLIVRLSKETMRVPPPLPCACWLCYKLHRTTNLLKFPISPLLMLIVNDIYTSSNGFICRLPVTQFQSKNILVKTSQSWPVVLWTAAIFF